MVKDYGMCSCGGRIHPQWFFGKKYLECAKCGNPDKNAESFEAESKKLPPVEKAEISGIASGATMEGLEMLAAEEPPEKDDPLESWMEDYDAETERWIRIPSPTKYSPFYGKGYAKKRIFPNEQEARRDYEKLIREEPSMTGYRGGTNIGVECGCGNFVLKEEPIWNHRSQIRGWDIRNHPIQVHSKNIDRSHHYWGHEPTSEEWEFATRWKEGEKNIVEIEGATKDWLEFERITYMPMRMLEAEDTEDPSVYWWVKGALMENTKDRDMTEDDLVYIIQMVAANAPMDSITKGMREAEQFGDKGVWEILKLAAMGRAEILTDKQIHSEKLRDYRSEEVVMIECPHCYEFGDGEIPADIHYDPGDRWEPPSLDVNSWETCEWCNGKGEVTEEEAEGIPTWDWDILEPDEPDYDRYDAECVICKDEIGEVVCTNCVLGKSAEETNGDKQLELALKRTQMSALRTGLSVLTFGIVILSTFTGWNFWTNKKQEQQISDIMGLV